MQAALIDDNLIDYVPTFIHELLPPSITQYFHHVTARIGNVIIDLLPRICCGSSGAVCTLIGFSIPCDIRDIYQLMQNKRHLDNNTRLLRLLRILFTVFRASQYLLGEASLITLDRDSVFQISKSYGLLSMLSISHSAHIQGGLIGLLLGLCKVCL